MVEVLVMGYLGVSIIVVLPVVIVNGKVCDFNLGEALGLGFGWPVIGIIYLIKGFWRQLLKALKS